ncbi:Tfb4-domain-containing protein, partial [Basidiobolus meristosporus CBS 931.73]
DDPSLLVIVLDTNPFSWSKSENSTSPLSFNSAQNHLLIFIHAYLSLKPDNRIAVVASHLGASRFIYPTEKTESVVQSEETSSSSKDANVYQRFKSIDKQISRNLKKLIDSPESSTKPPLYSQGASAISGAFSMALCYINRMIKRDDLGRIKPRLLVLSVSTDSPYQYIPIMNCIFSAQKAFTFLPDKYVRTYFCLPGRDQVDFRAACFCHKKVIDVGYVCSVCLSIFCGFAPVCSTCRLELELLMSLLHQHFINPAIPERNLSRGTECPTNLTWSKPSSRMGSRTAPLCPTTLHRNLYTKQNNQTIGWILNKSASGVFFNHFDHRNRSQRSVFFLFYQVPGEKIHPAIFGFAKLVCLGVPLP